MLENHLNTLDLAAEQGRQARSISQHGVPTGVLTTSNPDATQTDMATAKAAWLQSQRDRTIAALGPMGGRSPIWRGMSRVLTPFTLRNLRLPHRAPGGPATMAA